MTYLEQSATYLEQSVTYLEQSVTWLEQSATSELSVTWDEAELKLRKLFKGFRHVTCGLRGVLMIKFVTSTIKFIVHSEASLCRQYIVLKIINIL